MHTHRSHINTIKELIKLYHCTKEREGNPSVETISEVFKQDMLHQIEEMVELDDIEKCIERGCLSNISISMERLKAQAKQESLAKVILLLGEETKALEEKLEDGVRICLERENVVFCINQERDVFYHKNYQKVLKKLRKRQERKAAYLYMDKDTEIYKKQRKIVSKILNTSSSLNTVKRLFNYGFLDTVIQDDIKVFYRALTTSTFNKLDDARQVLRVCSY